MPVRRARGPRRDFAALAQRRARAAEMFRRGKRQVDVVTKLGVSAQTASRWHATWLKGGKAALCRQGRPGRPRQLSDAELVKVEKVLLAGPLAAGYPTQLWTLARVGEVIERISGVRYSTTQTWTILRERLGWTRQRPARRAVERDDAAVAAWVKDDWPRIKKAPGAAAPGSSSKTKAGSPSSRS
ncbi:MAG: winged helix-turn-helix domain-containing protein [Pseudonocardiaceae bacterium]